MAIEILNMIKAAEETAQETRRVAAIAANDTIKLAEQENNAYKEKTLADVRVQCDAVIKKADQETLAELDALKKQRQKSCESLKKTAQQKLDQAAALCLERILK